MPTEKLAIHGGKPVRKAPLPLEFPGIHHMNGKEREAVLEVLNSRSPFRYYGVKLTRQASKFEAEFARFLGVKHAVAVSSGTAALQVALAAMGVGPGQEVIIPAYMWVSVAAAVVNQGAVPVLADIDQTFCMDPSDLQKRITPKTVGVVVVHMSGAPADIKALLKVARQHRLFLLEDCAQCAGGSVGGQKVGSFGDIGTFSFQMNKNMTSLALGQGMPARRIARLPPARAASQAAENDRQNAQEQISNSAGSPKISSGRIAKNRRSEGGHRMLSVDDLSGC